MIQNRQQTLLNKQKLIQLFSFIGLIFFGLFVVVKVDNMLASFVLAFVISYMLTPLVNSFERMGLSRTPSILITFVLISLLVGFLSLISLPFLTTQLGALQSELPKYIDGTTRLIVQLENKLGFFVGNSMDLNFSQKVKDILLSNTSHLFEGLPQIVSKSLTVLLLAPFFAYFLLKDGRLFTQKLLSLVPNHLFEVILNLNHKINQQMGQFVRARLLEAAFVGSIVFIGLFFIGFRYATLLSLFAALMNLIPYVGPIIGVVPALIVAFINGESTLGYILVCSIYGVAQLLDIIIIIPLVVAKIVNLHPITVVVSIIIGAQLMGVLGMIISIPVTSALKVTLSTIYQQALGD
jgi:putative permease